MQIRLLKYLVSLICSVLIPWIGAYSDEIFYSETGKLKHKNLDTNFEKVLVRGLSSVSHLVYDDTDNLLYWADPITESIWKSSADGQNRIEFIKGLKSIQGLRIDKDNRILYWSDMSSGTRSIKRSDLAGLQIEILTSVSSDSSFADFDIDQAKGKIYMAGSIAPDFAGFGNFIYQMNFDGSGRVKINIPSDFSANIKRIAVHPELQKLYYSDDISPKLFEYDIAANKFSLIAEKIGANSLKKNPFYLDLKNNYLYWTSFNTLSNTVATTIVRKKLDGTGTVENVSGGAGMDIGASAIDANGTKIFHISNAESRILRTDISSQNRRVLLDSQAYKPAAMASDNSSNFFFWSSPESGRIYRTTLHFTRALQDIVTIHSNLNKPFGLAVDTVNKKLYWSETGANSVKRSNYDGTGIEALFGSWVSPKHIGIDVANNQLFVLTAESTSNNTLWRSDLQGKSRVLFLTTDSLINYFEFDPVSRRFIFTPQTSFFNSPYMLDANLKRTDVEAPYYDEIRSIGFDSDRQKVLILASRTNIPLRTDLLERNLDGTEEKVVRTVSYDTTSMHYVKGASELYMHDNSWKAILNYSFNAAALYSFVSFPDALTSLANIPSDNSFYFTKDDVRGGAVFKYNMANGAVSDIAVGQSASPLGLVFDNTNSKIYWASADDKKIFRANLDGSSRETVLGTTGTPSELAVNFTTGRLFWTESQTLKSSNLQGLDVKTENSFGLVGFGAGAPYRMSADAAQNNLYMWFNWSPNYILGKYSVSAKSTAGIRTYSGARGLGLFFDSETRDLYWSSPGTEVIKGDENGTTSAVVAGFGSTVKDLALNKAANEAVYIDEVDGRVYAVPLSGLSKTTRLIDLPYEITGVTYEPVSNKIYFMDAVKRKIFRISADGSNLQDITPAGFDFPNLRSLTIDTANSLVYFVEADDSGVYKMNLDGTGVVKLYSNITGIGEARDIKLDLALGHMYITDPEKGRIVRLNLNGTGLTQIVSGILKPRGLWIDKSAGKLYWLSIDTGLYSSNLDGTSITQVCAAVGTEKYYYLSVDSTAGLYYWSDFSTKKIYKRSLNCSNFSEVVSGKEEINGFYLNKLPSTVRGISGTILFNALPLPGVQVNAGALGNYFTDNLGQYSIPNITNGTAYTLSPVKSGYSFTPLSANGTANQNITQNFTAHATSAQTHTISGTVTSGGSPLAGVVVSAASLGSATTNSLGQYSIGNVPYLSSYTLFATKDNYKFTPSYRSGIIQSNITANFTATITTSSYTLSGRVVRDYNTSIGAANIIIDGGALGTRITDSNGNYSFGKLVSGAAYKIQILCGQCEVTNPVRQGTMNGNKSEDFNLKDIGTITIGVSGAGAGVQGVKISNTLLGEKITDQNGRVSYPNIPRLSAPYQFTASFGDFVLSPASISLNPGSSGGFSIPKPRTFSGIVKYNGQPLSGVKVTNVSQTVFSGADGKFKMTNLEAQPHIFYLTKDLYTITGSPVIHSLTDGDVLNIEFTSTCASGITEINGKCEYPIFLEPVLDCVIDRGDGSYLANFGYKNTGQYYVFIEAGQNLPESNTINFISGNTGEVFLNESFSTGEAHGTFSAPFTSSVTWTLQTPGSRKMQVTANPSSKRCLAVKPILECVKPSGSNRYQASFGYSNLNSHALDIPAGDFNYFTPDPKDRGQAEYFSSGRVINRFQVSFAKDDTITWTIPGDSVTANKSSNLCEPIQPPGCNIFNGNTFCSGNSGRVNLSAVGSNSKYSGQTISYKWSTNCPASQIDNTSGSSTNLIVSVNSAGISPECEVTLTVDDGYSASQCSTSIRSVSCGACTKVVDQCQICGGNNSCLDCNGIPNGKDKKDSCGVCGGNDACVDCSGTPNGTASNDRCGICGGFNECLGCTQNDGTANVKELYASYEDTVKVYKSFKKLAAKAASVKKITSLIKLTSAKPEVAANESLENAKKILKTVTLNCPQTAGCDDIDRGPALTSLENNIKTLTASFNKISKKGKKHVNKNKLLKAQQNFTKATRLFSDSITKVSRFESFCAPSAS